jgi:hypothetical protein
MQCSVHTDTHFSRVWVCSYRYDRAISETKVHEEEAAKFEVFKQGVTQGTVHTRLGELLKNKSVRVEQVIKEWDKYRSGTLRCVRITCTPNSHRTLT